MQGGCPQTVSTETDHLDSLYRDIRKIICAKAALGYTYYSVLHDENLDEYVYKELNSSANILTNKIAYKKHKSKNEK